METPVPKQSHILLGRRAILCAAAAALAPSVAWAERPPLANPSGLGPIPESWQRAEMMRLWRRRPPNGGFHPRPVPPNAPAGFIRNVAIPELRVFRPERSNGRALLVIPGGAYTFVVVTHEGTSVAEAMSARGYTVFVLLYRLPGEGWRGRSDVPLQDAQRAMRLIKANARTYGFDPQRTAVVGFSAGGHLAASLATGFAEHLYDQDATDRLDARPAAAALIYPVITLSPAYTHQQSKAALLGPDPSADLVARRSPELHVTSSTPPTFLAHALDDGAVPFQNSALMLEALQAARVPAEAHFFEEGGHGFGLGATNSSAGLWPSLFSIWLDRIFSAG